MSPLSTYHGSTNTLSTNQLHWQLLKPNFESYTTLLEQASQLEAIDALHFQPRLKSALKLFCHNYQHSKVMLVKAEENRTSLTLLHDAVKQSWQANTTVYGGHYQIKHHHVLFIPAQTADQQFAVTPDCLYEEWFEREQLLGSVINHHGDYSLQPGLVHRANGGILILSVKTLLSQPILWLRLKQIITSQQFIWTSADETKPLPLIIEPMPLHLKVILVGNRESLADLQEFEPELSANAIYTEFESILKIQTPQDLQNWCAYLNFLCDYHQLPRLTNDAYLRVIESATRESGEQTHLLISPDWLSQKLIAAAHYAPPQTEFLDSDTFQTAEHQQLWRENYLLELMLDDVKQEQLQLTTEGMVIGQINGLSVIEYPGHPRPFGEVSRISCVVHFGDGEITDVERKAELGGNLHAKGMMIMQAFIASELATDQQLPFSASIVFEQSYGEVDGDSASLAELCVLLSALSLQPINQEIAVTGSVDQLGNVQPIGGINEKIEAFFNTCKIKGLTGTQGVIIPHSNIRHLVLNFAVVEAVKEGVFHIWPVEHACDAITLLTGIPYHDDTENCLLSIIQDRIELLHSGHKHHYPWFLRWVNWF